MDTQEKLGTILLTGLIALFWAVMLMATAAFIVWGC